MNYRSLFNNIIKCTQTYVKLNYFVTNVRQSCSQTNMFIRHLTQTHMMRNYYKENYKFHKETVKYFALSGSIIFALFDFFKEKEEDETSELIMTIKRSVLLIQKGEFEKAERMLHIALREAQTLQSYDGITYIYDLMANLAFETQNYKKAEKLFISVMQRLMSTGALKDDLRIIHISLKIAKIYNETGDLQKAEDGYQFCIENLEQHLLKDDRDETVVSLLGTTLEWYATMLFSQDKYAQAVKYLSQAYDLCSRVNGNEHEQTVILLNDLGTVHSMMGEYDKAIEYLSMAAEIGNKLPEMTDLGSIHINLGNVFIKKGLFNEAKKYCNRGRKMAKSRQDPESVVEAENCLKEIKKQMSSTK